MAVTAPRPGRSLSARSLALTVATVLTIALVAFVPALTHERQEWLSRRIVEAQIAAFSAAAAPDGLVDKRISEPLLRLSGTEMIRMTSADRTLVVVQPSTPLAVTEHVDLAGETLPRAAYRAIASLLNLGDPIVEVSAAAPMQPEGTLSVVVHGGNLNRFLRRFAGTFGLLALAVAVFAGLLVYVALWIFLVRPMRHITGSIHSFRADPERTPPLSAENTMPLRDDEMAVAADELSAMQRELRTALWRNARLAAIGTAVAKVSHDLRGLLAPALLAAERLQSNSDPGVRRVGDILVKTVERAAELLRDTVEFAREGPPGPRRSRCVFAEIVTEAIEQVRTAEFGVNVQVSCPSGLEIDVERMHLLRVFANLLRNAAEAKARVVRVETELTRTQVTILIADDAGGLPQHVQDNLFRPFVTGERRGSTGLGLAIVHDLVRAQGGEIVLVATGPAGTSFRITLPAAAAYRPPSATPPEITGDSTRPAAAPAGE